MATDGHELLDAVRDAAREDGITHTGVPYLSLLRATRPNHLNQGMLRPSFCMVVQGEKEILIGDRLSRYGEGGFVLAAVSLPTSGHILRADAATPYFGICVNLELMDIAAAAMKMSPPQNPDSAPGPAAYVAQANFELRDVLLRLVRASGKPDEARALAPLLMQEMLYRLLSSESGHLLHGMIAGSGGAFEIAKAVEHIKTNHTQPLVVGDLAAMANMSFSGFHNKFKAMTTVSPIQYQKKVRLLEARRMLLAGDMDAAMAALMVGYESPTQFSREYRRHFGLPPMKDIARLKNDPMRNPPAHPVRP